MKVQTRCLRALLVAFLLVPSTRAQFDAAEVLGTVLDPSSAVLANVNIILRNQDTGVEARTTSEAGGNFNFFDIKVGRYMLSALLDGFATFTATDIVVDVNAGQRVNISMKVGAASEMVEVHDVAQALETDTTEHGQAIRSQQVTELPLNGRNYADLALLSTNAVKSPIAVSFSPTGTPREGAFKVNGMRSTYNNSLLDGRDNNAYSSNNQGFCSQQVQVSPVEDRGFRKW
jgi:hypothetical protein